MYFSTLFLTFLCTRGRNPSSFLSHGSGVTKDEIKNKTISGFRAAKARSEVLLVLIKNVVVQQCVVK